MIAATPPACYAKISAYYATNHEVGPFYTQVVTDGAYAFVNWHGTQSGGVGIFRHSGGRWCVVTNGGGWINVDEMVHYGVPRATAQRLYAKMKRVHP